MGHDPKNEDTSGPRREGLGVEPLLLRRLPMEVFQARPAGRRARGRPRTRWRGYISSLAWERLGTPQSELVDEGKGTFGALLRDPTTEKREKMDGWMDGQ